MEDIKQNQDTVFIKVNNLVKYFPIIRGIIGRHVGDVKAVDGVSFEIPKGKTLGLVGESGSGKTTVGRTILRLMEPTRGEVWFEGKNVFKMKPHELRVLRRDMQIIFQDPFGSLNPRFPVGDIIGEPLLVHGIGTRKEREERVKELMEIVGLRPEYLRRYPHEFSGGQRQRIGIARALAMNPKFIVADEPVSALDVSIQSQIINLLIELQGRFNLTYLFIAHDLAVVKHMSDRVAVMYLGKLMETANNEDLFGNPLHPYTQALLSAVPVPDPDVKKQRIILQGDIPSPINPPKGCVFHTRCRYRFEPCDKEIPEPVDVGNNHIVWCHLIARQI
ncbi:MAG: dipeptide ABC transporter ATP-binding protein [Coprothermobacterota bacterium]|jgi:oligopeptide/dipeptide ABC transporter ATP-binding protein|nr:dipeptide ABC transporter ATP-binding protein [Caldisericota bacterium]MDI6869590.1 dipeptide ABC transporter ATP-binding protein [Coprothermobacterota bacterium]